MKWEIKGTSRSVFTHSIAGFFVIHFPADQSSNCEKCPLLAFLLPRAQTADQAGPTFFRCHCSIWVFCVVWNQPDDDGQPTFPCACWFCMHILRLTNLAWPPSSFGSGSWADAFFNVKVFRFRKRLSSCPGMVINFLWQIIITDRRDRGEWTGLGRPGSDG